MGESTSVALMIASHEYQRRVQQAQAASARVDQTPTILGTGLTLLLSALVAIYAATWPADRSRFWLAAAAVCAMSSVFTVLVIYRDFVARSSLTDAEKAQTRLRHYFVSQAPEVQPYLSDTIYDDWPTPFNNPRGSKTFGAWLVLVMLASLFLGTATLGPSLRVSKDWAGNEEVPSDQGKWDLLRVRVSCHGRHLLGEG
ncbi:hypothetical protein, partial [Micromonospora craterilacus]|uniref:hypothetical protein n=1 Tax=Micromonospora craterilacus TaxID=1655439 RepID=UPI0011B43300